MNSLQDKSVVLARVSSRAQQDEGYSLDSQEKLLGEYNLRQGFKVEKIFKIAESASKETARKIFHEMMQYVRKQEIHIITVEKVDRFVRNFKDVVLTDEWLEENEENQVHFVKDGITLRKNSKSTEKLNWGIRVVIAKNYIDNLREEVLKGQKEKLAQGWFPATPPVGYISVDEGGKRIHIIDTEKAPLVKRVFEKYLEPEMSLNSLAVYAEQIGLTSGQSHPIVRTHLTKNILRNKFYIGINTWVGKESEGAQETFIDKSLFDAVQNKMTRKTAPRYKKHNPDLKDVFFCSNCGNRITWEQHKGYWYGHCNFKYNNCPPTAWVRQDNLEKQLMPYLYDIVCPDPKIRVWIIDHLKSELEKGYTDNSEIIARLTGEQERLKRQLGLLYEDRLAERITTDYYDTKLKEIEAKIVDIGKRITSVDTESSNNLIKGIKILETSQLAYDEYQNMSSNDKKRLILEIFSNCYINGQSIEVEYTPQAQNIAEKVKMHNDAVTYFRLPKKRVANRGEVLLEQQFQSIWSRVGIQYDFRPVLLNDFSSYRSK